MKSLKNFFFITICLFTISCENLFDIKYSSKHNSPTLTETALLESWENTLTSSLKPADGRVNLKVALSNSDEAIIVWEHLDFGSGVGSMYKSEFRNGVWQHPSSSTDRMNSQTNDTFLVQLASNKNGDAVLVWVEDHKIYRWHYRNGSWGVKTLIGPFLGTAFDATVKINDSGEGIFAWTDASATYVSEFDGTTWSPSAEIRPDDTTVLDAVASIKVDIANNGDALVLVFRDDAGLRSVYKFERRGGVWDAPADLTDSLSTAGRDSRRASVNFSPAGKAQISWEEGTLGGDTFIYSQIHDGTSWSAPELIDSLMGNFLELYQASINDSEQVVVSYLSGASISTQLRFYDGSSWGTSLDTGIVKSLSLSIQSNQAEVYFLTTTDSIVRKTCTASGCNAGSVITTEGGSVFSVQENSQRTISIWENISGSYTTKGLETYSGTSYLLTPIVFN